jgi:hypothetical protein
MYFLIIFTHFRHEVYLPLVSCLLIHLYFATQDELLKFKTQDNIMCYKLWKILKKVLISYLNLLSMNLPEGLNESM